MPEITNPVVNPITTAIQEMAAAFAAVNDAKDGVKRSHAAAARAAAAGHRIRGFSWDAAASSLPGNIKKDTARMYGFAGLALLKFHGEWETEESAGVFADKLRKRLSTKVSNAHLPIATYSDWLNTCDSAKALYSAVDQWVDPNAPLPLTDLDRLIQVVSEFTNDGSISSDLLGAIVAAINS